MIASIASQYFIKVSANQLIEVQVESSKREASEVAKFIDFQLSGGISKEEIIKRHFEVVYTVYFIGFLPGFLYLGGLDEALYTPRKSTPRLCIEKGAVARAIERHGGYRQRLAADLVGLQRLLNLVR